jgi:hypothetical protein
MKLLNTNLTTQPFSRANKNSLNEIVATILKFNVGAGVNALGCGSEIFPVTRRKVADGKS